LITRQWDSLKVPLPLSRQITQQPIDGHVQLGIILVRAGFDLRLDLGHLVSANIVALQRLEQVVNPGQFEPIDQSVPGSRLGRELLLHRLGDDLLDGGVAADPIDVHGWLRDVRLLIQAFDNSPPANAASQHYSNGIDAILLEP